MSYLPYKGIVWNEFAKYNFDFKVLRRIIFLIYNILHN